MLLSLKTITGRWTIYVCDDCGQVYGGHIESCHSPLHGIKDPGPVEVVAVDAMLTDEAIKAAECAVYAEWAKDETTTKADARTMIQAAIAVAASREDRPS